MQEPPSHALVHGAALEVCVVVLDSAGAYNMSQDTVVPRFADRGLIHNAAMFSAASALFTSVRL